MKKTEIKAQSYNTKTQNSQIKNKYVQNIQNIFTSVYDDEFIGLINELSLLIKAFYKSISPNLSITKNILNSSELTSNNINDIHLSLKQTFSEIENAFNKFYQNAKIIFKKMKVYRNEKIENIINSTQKIDSPKRQNDNNLNKSGITNNNINISNNIIHNDGINVNGTNFSMIINNTENNINNNIKLKLDKLKTENSLLKKKLEMFEKKNKTISPNKIPKPIKIENYTNQTKNLRGTHNPRINSSVNDDERSNTSISQNLSFYDEKLKMFQKENEKYKKDLHKLSYEINRFLINFKQIKNLEIPEGLKTSLEKGKITLSQLTANFLKKNSLNDISLISPNTSYNKENNELKNIKESINKIKYEKEKIKNYNAELRKEIEKLKNSTPQNTNNNTNKNNNNNNNNNNKNNNNNSKLNNKTH